MRSLQLLVLLVTLAILVAAGDGQAGLRFHKKAKEPPTRVALTNREALESGLPLPRPRSIPNCGPGGCNATVLEQFALARRNRKLEARASVIPTTVPTNSVNYAQTCRNIVYDFSSSTSPKVTAQCLNQAGVYVTSTLAYSSCISNIAGTLTCLGIPGFFALSCSSCSVNAAQLLRCTCNLFQSASMNLNTCIGNNNGILQCTGITS